MSPACTILAALLYGCASQAHAEVPRLALKYRDTLTRNARIVWGIDAPIPVFAGQVEQESGWDERATSRVGAQGMTQFMPSTAAWIAKAYPELGAAEPYNASWALRALVRYDKHLWDQLDYARPCDRIGAALSGYNGGAGWHNKRRAKADDPQDFWHSVRVVNPGILPANQLENEQYPQRIVYKKQPTYAAWGPTLCLGDPQ